MDLAAAVAYMVTRKPIKGKKALQKLLYFCTETGLPLRLSFKMHLYGPYSNEVAQEYDRLVFGNILVEEGEERVFRAGSECRAYLEMHGCIIKQYQKQLDKILDLFGDLTPWQLELYATLHFISVSLATAYGKVERDEVIAQLRAAKGGKFSEEEIATAYSNLEAWGLLS